MRAPGKSASAAAATRRSIGRRGCAPDSSLGTARPPSAGASTVIVAGLYERIRFPNVASAPANDAPYRLLDDVTFGAGVVVFAFTNLYGCRIGDRSRIGAFVEIQRGASIGADCKIQSHTFVCNGV